MPGSDISGVAADLSTAEGAAGLRDRAGRSAADGSPEVIRFLDDEPFVVAHGRTGAGDAGEAKAVVRDCHETVHIGGRHDRIGRYVAGERQVRHESGVRDGVAAFERDLAVLTGSRTIDEIVLLIGQGDLVFIAARGTHEGEPCASVDLYRVEGDKLVEHWGFPQPMPSRMASMNRNGML